MASQFRFDLSMELITIIEALIAFDRRKCASLLNNTTHSYLGIVIPDNKTTGNFCI